MPRKVAKNSRSTVIDKGLHMLSWWSRYHNHVYGTATILGLLLAGAPFFKKKPEAKQPPSTSQVVGLTSQSSGQSPSLTEPRASSAALPDASEAQIVKDASNFSPITIDEYFKRWYEATDLQRDELEKGLLGKTIIWNGIIKRVQSGDNGGVSVWVNAGNTMGSTAFLDFDASQKQEFLRLREGQSIRFTCTFKGFVASPFLDKCRLISILN